MTVQREGLLWYQRKVENALRGMRNLTPEQRGIYNTLLDLIYFTGDNLEDHDARNAAHNNCHVRVYRRIKSELIALGKIYLEAVGNSVYIRNETAVNEVVNARLLIEHSRINGQLGGRVSAASKDKKRSNFNGGGQPPGQPPGVGAGQHTYKDSYNYTTERPFSGSSREGSAAQPEGRASPSADDIASHPESAVRAFAAQFENGDAAAWVAYGATIERQGKTFAILAPTPAKAALVQSRFGSKLRASLKKYDLKSPGEPDISIT